MSAQPEHRQRFVRRVVLPSGKAIEVVYFDEGEDAQRGSSRAADGLHVCGSCASRLVYPVDWQETGSSYWRVSLRCPNCEWTGTGVFEQDALERFDEELDRATETLVHDLKRLVRANMEEQVERFVAALHAGLILPEDF